MNKLVVQFYLETTSPVRSSELGLRFKLYDGVERVINNVRLVPDLKRNLISLSEFDKKGYVFKSKSLEMSDSKMKKKYCLVVN